jgi:4a-hydroxytetrahydrobiopterin dehydratase
MEPSPEMPSGKHCRPCEGGVAPLTPRQVDDLLKGMPGWQRLGNELVKTFVFKDYYRTIAFVNATAWVSHREDHHPDLEVGYRQCRVRYSTHAIGGLSENDFICAEKIDALYSS